MDGLVTVGKFARASCVQSNAKDPSARTNASVTFVALAARGMSVRPDAKGRFAPLGVLEINVRTNARVTTVPDTVVRI